MDILGQTTTLRLISRDDLPACIEIVRRNYDQSIARLAAMELAHSSLTTYVAEQDGVIVGCAAYAPATMDYGVYEICWINVTPASQRRGIGRMLVEKCLADVRSVGNMVLLSARTPQYYAEHWGFRAIHNYGDGKSIMALEW